MAGGARTTVKRLKNVLSLKKQTTTAELVKQLKALHEELESLEQETIEINSLDTTKKELISKSLLTHKDKSVKAYTACCVADVLRLYAPDAPYTDHELKDIFTFFFVQLRNLTKPGDVHTAQYHYLLRNLSEIKTVCLVCELPGAEELLIKIFDDLFDALSPATTSRQLEKAVTEILSCLIDEMQTIPMDVTTRIVAQFEPRNVKARPHAVRVATTVCTDTQDKLQRYVSQYFTETLGSPDGDAGSEDEDEDDLNQVKKAHAIIKEIYRAAPGLLLNVIPQLEAGLQTGNTALRTLATKTIGEMLSETGAMAKTYPTLWTSWIGRAQDKTPAVRIAVLEALKPILSNHSIRAAEIQQTLVSKLVDPEEKVRIAACGVFGSLDYETALRDISIATLKLLSDRAHDKKPHVVAEARKALGRLYSLAYSAIESADETAVDKFSWIPASIIDSARTSDPEIQATTISIILQYILPLPKSADDEEAWVDRFVLVYSLLEPASKTQLRRLAGIEGSRPVYAAFIATCEKYNGGIIDKDEDKVTTEMKRMARAATTHFPNASKASEDLVKFAKLNDNRLYKLLRTMLEPQTELKSLLKAHQELLRRLGETASSLVDTMTLFVQRSAYLLLGRSSIPTLLNHVETPPEGQGGENAALISKELLTCLSKHRAIMYKPHMDRLTEILADESGSAAVDVALLALAELGKIESLSTAPEGELRDRALFFIQHGSVLQAKSAATILARDTDAVDDVSNIVGDLASSLSQTEGLRLVVHLSALSRFAKYSPAAFRNYSEAVIKFALHEVLLKADETEMELDADVDWAPDENLSFHSQASLAAIKLLTNHCLAYGLSLDASIVVKPVLNLLWTLLDNGGDIKAEAARPPAVAARLRSQAAISLLRLASIKAYEADVIPRFELLAWTIQDAVFQVRNAFLHKLVTYTFQQRLTNPIFNLILFLVAHDPEQENKNMASSNIRNRARSLPQEMRIRQFEQIFARLLHLLAHHPDFSTDPDDIAMTAQYIRFYLENIAGSENISFLYHLAAVLKTVRDAATDQHNELIYLISEIAQHLIKHIARSHGWVITTYVGKVVIPNDLFRALASTEEAKEIRKTTYLEAEAIQRLDELFKAAPKQRAAPKKRKTSPKPKATGAKKPAKRRKKEKEEGWDEDEASDHESDADAGATSEEEAKPSGSKSRPKAKPASAKKKKQTNGHASEAKAKAGGAKKGAKSKKKRSDDEMSEG